MRGHLPSRVENANCQRTRGLPTRSRLRRVWRSCILACLPEVETTTWIHRLRFHCSVVENGLLGSLGVFIGVSAGKGGVTLQSTSRIFQLPMRTSRPGAVSRSAAVTKGTGGSKSSILFVRAARAITNNSACFRFCWTRVFWSEVRKTSKPAAAASLSNAAFFRPAHPCCWTVRTQVPFEIPSQMPWQLLVKQDFARSLKTLWAAWSAATA